MVCMTLLAIMGSVMIYKGTKLLQERRFSSSCETLTSEIFLTKSLAISYQIDIHLILEQKNGKFYLTRNTDFSPKHIKPLLESRVELPELVFGKEDLVKEFYFYGNGWIDGEEKLILFMASHLKKQYNVEVKHSYRKAV